MAAATTAVSNLSEVPFGTKYGDIPLVELQSKTIVDVNEWTLVENLDDSFANHPVKIRGRVHTIRPMGNKMTSLIIRENGFTVHCCVEEQEQPPVSPQMVEYAATLSLESIVDVEGVVSIPEASTQDTTQQVEVQVMKLHCVSRAASILPIILDNAAQSEVEMEMEMAIEAGKQPVRANYGTLLNSKVFDLGATANEGILRIQSHVERVFMQFLWAENFTKINTPKLIAGSSEGGALDCKGHPAYLAQSPQLYKQMSICGDFSRVFEISPVFRTEYSFTYRHPCEFTGLDVEMEIKMHYSELIRLFVAIFDSLNQNCKKDLKVVGNQYPFKPLKYLRNTLRLTYEEGIEMLKEVGVEIEPFGDLNTEAEWKLGQLVLEKYGTEFYILHRYPLTGRPFYTMPCHDKPEYSNSFHVFVRGEDIILGAQRIHEPKLLEQRAQACGIDVNIISDYIDSFRYGAPPHGGFEACLERVVMLFCDMIAS